MHYEVDTVGLHLAARRIERRALTAFSLVMVLAVMVAICAAAAQLAVGFGWLDHGAPSGA